MFIVLALAVSTASAANFTVTNTNDSGQGSLRQAIADAGVNRQADIISFDAVLFSTPRTILLTTGELVIPLESDLNGSAAPMSIVGPGPNLLTIDANYQSRIFRAENSFCYFAGMTLRRGFATRGGAIYAPTFGQIDVSNAVITENVAEGGDQLPGGLRAGAGGGIYAGGLRIWDSIISNNIARGIVLPSQVPGVGDGGTAGAGGGIYLYSSGSHLRNCQFIENQAIGASSPAAGDSATGAPGGSAFGGAVFSAFGPLTMNSTFTSNSAVGGDGGSGGTGGNGGGAQGGAVLANQSYLLNAALVANSSSAGRGGVSPDPTQAGNGAEASGGAIYERGIPTMANATVHGNSVAGGAGRTGGRGLGGGIYLNHRQFSIVNFTVTNNSAVGGIGTEVNGVGRGGGFFSSFVSTPPTPTFTNNIVAENLAPEGPDAFGIFPSAASNNLIRIGEGSTGMANGVNGNMIGTSAAPLDPVLGPLANNGGLTETRALLEGSPAINAGNNSVSSPTEQPGPLRMDQRNYARIWPAGGTIDIGAYELGSPNVLIAPLNPDLRDASDTGISATDNITTSTAPAFDFPDVIAGSRVELLRNGSVVASVHALTFFISMTDPAPPLDGTVVYTSRHVLGSEVGAASAGLTVTFDHTAPTGVIDQASTQADPTRLVPINFSVNFSEPVTGLTNANVSLAGSTANVATATKIVTGSGATYNVAIGNVVSNGGTVVASIPSRTAQDAAGNFSAMPTSTDNSVTLDNTPPTVTMNQASGQVDPTNSLPVNYTVIFSEPVTGFDAADILFSGSSFDTTGATVAISGSGTTYNVAIGNVIANGGLLRASVRSDAATDAIGNSNIASTSTDNSISIDNVSPAVTVEQAAGQADPTSTQPIRYAVVFSEIVTGFQVSDISLAGSTANVSLADIQLTGSGSNYSISISNVTSNGLVRVSVPAGAASDAIGNSNLSSTSADNTVTVVLESSPFDFDGDGKTDIGIFRPSVAEWWINRSSTGVTVAGQFGATTDLIAPGDFTGDGKADVTFFRPSTGEWFILRSEDGSYFSFPFGTNGDVPTPADFDADGKTDVAVFRPSTSTWFVLRSSDGVTAIQGFGSTGDVPVASDYDGDGKADIAIYRPSVGQWWISRSTGGVIVLTFGAANDKPVQGDYTGDGKSDIAIWNPSTGEWFILRSEDYSYYSVPFGTSGDIPAPGDYDGDGKNDTTVFRPSSATWFSQRSTAGIMIQQFGSTGDRPIPNAFVP